MNKMDNIPKEVEKTIEQITREQKKVFEDYYDTQIRKWVWYCCNKGCATINVKNPLDSVVFVDAWRYLETECLKNSKVNNNE
jgi:hypothetical protein|tara:strand:- start:996 stop:1241 length:246 start_codon:yes stop_codon:yes gene_type:complete